MQVGREREDVEVRLVREFVDRVDQLGLHDREALAGPLREQRASESARNNFSGEIYRPRPVRQT
jgi:hypothetical protein